MQVQISYENKGDVHTIITGGAALPQLVIDNTGLSPDQRSGTAKHLLACATVFCYMSSFLSAMEARDVRYSNVKATVTLELGKNDKGQGRVTKMIIDVTADVKKEDEDVFERVKKIMKQGCLVSGSVEEGIEMEYNLNTNWVE